MKERKLKKTVGNILFFILLIVITLYILLKDQDVFDIINTIRNATKMFVLIGIISMFFYLLLEGINMRRTLKALGENITVRQSIKYSLIGFFFSSITPAASGGQPMQIYFMHRDNVSVAKSTLALLINLSSMQIITISFAFISLFFNYQYLNQALVIFFIIGILLNISALALLIIGICSSRLSKALINLAIKILKFFKIKNIEEKQEKLEKELEKYQYSAKYIKANKKLIVKTILTTAIQFIIYYSVSYWTYRSLGMNQENIFKIITMQSIVFATVSGIPSPGAVGVSEGAFIQIFGNIYPANMINSATLLSRGVSFYLFVIISGIVVLVNKIKAKNKQEKDV